MMFEKDDLGLSLGFNLPKKQVNLKSNPSVSLTPSSSSFGLLRRSSLNESFNSSVPYSDSSRVETRTFIRGIDVNQPPSTAEYGDEDAGVSSPNSTVSSSTGKRSEREEDTDPQGSRGISDDEDGDNSRKKLRLSKDQSAILEETFKDHSTLNPKQKQALAKQLGLRARQVEVWFQNRRARTKLKQTEVDCEFLRRCCENLTEENRRLQKEVTELRSLKLSPQFYMHMNPPTTLTMCPSCEHVSVPPPPPQPQPQGAALGHHQRSMPVNPWAPATRVSHGLTFDAFRPRS
ncbi:Homeobox-leucine zipper protein HAT4 [Raphanus sativus]|uniref:Homeobox-leucine zipper protein HAT4 n=1 Tax=Raphanus sativus TaxID=3726 RepID=A0A6J0KXN6_RAPSA|nr:homeobox-leucine zipper protein HAT4 [Raphanus sativus]KAJ4912436.1 Homeobox-leucine zipper protein HAT4 [Raphanus sativus]